jgi:hypothetical protein
MEIRGMVAKSNKEFGAGYKSRTTEATVIAKQSRPGGHIIASKEYNHFVVQSRRPTIPLRPPDHICREGCILGFGIRNKQNTP